MREMTVTVYSFAELSDDAKKRALNAFRDINVEFDWWEGSYYTIRAAGTSIVTGKQIGRAHV